MIAANGWQVVRELGRGGMGVVYEVERAGVRRALKQLISADAEQLVRFEREARAMARLGGSASVVRIHESGSGPDGPWFLMDLMPGGSLRSRLEGTGSLDPREACRLMALVGESLASVHAAGIIHRDLKLENVLLDEQGRPALADFGLVRSDDERGLTRSVALMGTLGAMAPEQLEGRTAMVGSEADVWALGVMLHELITGLKPFEGANPAQILGAIHGGRRSSSVREAVDAPPRGLEELIDAALAIEPEHRPDAGEFARRCREVAEAEAVEPPRPGLRALVALAVLVMAGALGAVGYRAVSQRRAAERATRNRRARAIVRDVEAAIRGRIHARLAARIGGGPEASSAGLDELAGRLEELPGELRDRAEVAALFAALAAVRGEARTPGDATGPLEALAVLAMTPEHPQRSRFEPIARNDEVEPELVPLMSALRELAAGDPEAAATRLAGIRRPGGVARELIEAARDRVEFERAWMTARRGDSKWLHRLLQEALKAPDSELGRRFKERLARELGSDRPAADRRALLAIPSLRWPSPGCRFMPRPLPTDLAQALCEDFVRSTYRASDPRLPAAVELGRALSHAMPLLAAGGEVPEELRLTTIARDIDKPGWDTFAESLFHDSESRSERVEGLGHVVLGLARGGAWPRVIRSLRHRLLPGFARRRGDPAFEPGATYWWLYSVTVGAPIVAKAPARERLEAARFLLEQPGLGLSVRGTVLECKAAAELELAFREGRDTPVESELRVAIASLRESQRVGGGFDPSRVAMRLSGLLLKVDPEEALAQCEQAQAMLAEHLALSGDGRLAEGRSRLDARDFLTPIEHEDRIQALLGDKIAALCALGRREQALEVYEERLALRLDQPARRGSIMLQKAELLVRMKRYAQARQVLRAEEVRGLAGKIASRRDALLKSLEDRARRQAAGSEDSEEQER